MNIMVQAGVELRQQIMRIHNGCLWADRGTGKSYGLACRAFVEGPGSHVIITSASLIGSRLVLKYLEEICGQYGVVFKNIFYNVRCVAVSSLKDQTQGMDNFLLLVDEFDTIPSEFRNQITSHYNWVGCASK